jgi:N-acetylglucosamine kinase
LAVTRVLAADLGGSFIRLACVDPASDRLPAIRSRPTPAQDFAALADALAALVAEEDAPRDLPLVVAAAGLIDPESGAVISAANLPCLTGRHPASALADRLGRVVHFVNDADAFALAEAVSGAGRGHRVVFGAIIGTGIGGGLVVEGRLVRGLRGIGGEWGHGPIAATRLASAAAEIPRMTCGCGRTGCADTFGSARGIERLHVALGEAPADSHAIVDAWRGGDPGAARTVAVWAEMLSEPLALVVNATGASRVPMGGGIGIVPDLVAELDAAVRSRTLLGPAEPLLVPARLGAQAGLLGAARFGLQLAADTDRKARPGG